jgi:hypothetical protein
MQDHAPGDGTVVTASAGKVRGPPVADSAAESNRMLARAVQVVSRVIRKTYITGIGV